MAQLLETLSMLNQLMGPMRLLNDVVEWSAR